MGIVEQNVPFYLTWNNMFHIIILYFVLFVCVGRIIMLVTCKNCGCKFKINKSGIVSCPACGKEQYALIGTESNNDAMPIGVVRTCCCEKNDDFSVSGAGKVLLAFSIVLVVLTVARFTASILFDNFSAIKDEMNRISEVINGTEFVSNTLMEYQCVLEKLLFLSYAEVFLHIVMFACSVFILMYTIKAKPYKFVSARKESVACNYLKKTIIWSIAMIVVSIVYAIIEACAIDIGHDTGIMSSGLMFGAWTGVMCIMISSIVCLAISKNLYRSEKQKIK